MLSIYLSGALKTQIPELSHAAASYYEMLEAQERSVVVA